MKINKWLLILIVVIVIALGSICLITFSIKNNKTNKAYKNKSFLPLPTENSQINSSPETPTDTPIVTPVEAPIEATPISQPASVSGGPRGQIVCNYQIPPDATNYGSADIESNWNNLIPGSKGTTKAAICVSVNGSSSLMSLDTTANGSRSTEINWIILNASYTFTLYDDHGGDLPDCGGAVLSSCGIKTIVSSPAKNIPNLNR